jgi:hypothetical protein
MGSSNPNPNDATNETIRKIEYQIGEKFTYYLLKDPINSIPNSTGAIIRHEIECHPITSNCKAVYQVFYQSQIGLQYAFRCFLSSKCNCCCKKCRTVNILFRHAAPDEIDPDLSKIILEAKKPCALNCCCFCRNEMIINYFEGEKSRIGKIIEPCGLCDIKADIYDENNNLLFRIVGENENLEIFDKNKSVVGQVKKTLFLSSQLMKSNTYKIYFPQKATPNEKILLISAVLFIEYKDFELYTG